MQKKYSKSLKCFDNCVACMLLKTLKTKTVQLLYISNNLMSFRFKRIMSLKLLHIFWSIYTVFLTEGECFPLKVFFFFLFCDTLILSEKLKSLFWFLCNWSKFNIPICSSGMWGRDYNQVENVIQSLHLNTHQYTEALQKAHRKTELKDVKIWQSV